MSALGSLAHYAKTFGPLTFQDLNSGNTSDAAGEGESRGNLRINLRLTIN